MERLKFAAKSAYGSQVAVVVGVAVLFTFAPATAFSADDLHGRDTEAPRYSVEIEPHVSFGLGGTSVRSAPASVAELLPILAPCRVWP